MLMALGQTIGQFRYTTQFLGKFPKLPLTITVGLHNYFELLFYFSDAGEEDDLFLFNYLGLSGHPLFIKESNPN